MISLNAPLSGGLHSTPVAPRVSWTHVATTNHDWAEAAFVVAAQEMRNKFQLVTIAAMLEMFPAKPGMPQIKRSPLVDMVHTAKREVDMYEPWVSCLRLSHHLPAYNGLQMKLMKDFLSDGWEMVNSSSSPDNDTASIFGNTAIKPVISGYSKGPRRTKPCDARDMDFFVEFKSCEGDEPFSTKETEVLELTSHAASDTRGQCTLYHNAIQASQQRTRVFSCYIRRQYCRLMCHSRAGTLVTPLFDYTTTSHLQFFLWRFSHANDEQRGFDTTFQPILDRSRFSKDVFTKLQLTEESPLYTVGVVGPASKPSEFYVSKPFTASHDFPVGRGTRCFSAYDPITKKVVLLKDTWRIASYTPEGEMYEKLHRSEVPNIPTVLAHGDVPGKLQICEIEDPNGTRRRLIHYRIVLDVIGKSLNTFSSTHELVTAVRDALIGLLGCFFETLVELT